MAEQRTPHRSGAAVRWVAVAVGIALVATRLADGGTDVAPGIGLAAAAWVCAGFRIHQAAVSAALAVFTVARALDAVARPWATGVALGAVLVIGSVTVRDGAIEPADRRLAARTGVGLLAGAILVPAAVVAAYGVVALPVIAWLLGRTRWTDLLRLRVVQLAAAGYVLLAAARAVPSGLVVDVAFGTGFVAFLVACVVTGYGVVRFSSAPSP